MSSIEFKSDIDIQLVQSMGSDVMVAAAAWVSTSGDEALRTLTESGESEKKIRGLIKYLIQHRHGTPFEHNALTFFVRAPIFVWREWHRHRIGFSYNEESGRYKKLDPVFYIPSADRPMFKTQDTEWKAGRPKFWTIEETEAWTTTLPEDAAPREYPAMEWPLDAYVSLTDNLENSYKFAYKMYEDNLDLGMDPGLARDCLPVGIYSSCWVTCNARSLMAFLSLRTHDMNANQVSYPLYEIEMAARKIEEIFAQEFPITYNAFCDNGRTGP